MVFYLSFGLALAGLGIVTANQKQTAVSSLKLFISVIMMTYFVSQLKAESGLKLSALIMAILADTILQIRHYQTTHRGLLLGLGMAFFMVFHSIMITLWLNEVSLTGFDRLLMASAFLGLLIVAVVGMNRLPLRGQGLKVGISIYGAFLILMVVVATGTAIATHSVVPALLRIVGAFLFAISDIMLIPLYFLKTGTPSLRAWHLIFFYVGEALLVLV